MTEYIITGRFMKDTESHRLSSIIRSYDEAVSQVNIIKHKEEEAQKNGVYRDKAGCFGVETPYYSDYALTDIKIWSREVSKWTEVKEGE